MLASQEVHDISVAIGVSRAATIFPSCGSARSASWPTDSDGAHIATLLCALFVRHFRALWRRACVRGDAATCFASMWAQGVLCTDEHERQGSSTGWLPTSLKGKVGIQRFKGLGEMNPMQLRETTIHPDTALGAADDRAG